MEAIRADFQRLFRESADPASNALQAVTDRHYRQLSHSCPPDAAAFKGLGRYYVENSEFRGIYDDAELSGVRSLLPRRWRFMQIGRSDAVATGSHRHSCRSDSRP